MNHCIYLIQDWHQTFFAKYIYLPIYRGIYIVCLSLLCKTYWLYDHGLWQVTAYSYSGYPHTASMLVMLRCLFSPFRIVQDSAIVEFSSAGHCLIWHRKSWKSWLFMALGKFYIFWVQNSHFWACNFHFPVCLEHHCSFAVHNLHFLCIELPLKCMDFNGNAEFCVFSMEFAFSEHRILGGVFRGPI